MTALAEDVREDVDALFDAFSIDPADRAPMREGAAETLAALDELDGLRPDARAALDARLRSRLATFAALQADRARFPAIAGERIVAPLVITGLPRSGTTILHSLVAQHPAVRSPLAWEVARPSPPPRAESFADDPRIDAWIADHAPGGRSAAHADAEFRKKHLIGACLPEECGQMIATSMRSTDMWSRAGVPSYMRWWLDADHRWDYAVHRRWLQHLQWMNPGHFWALKYPMHIFQLPSLVATYPDARLVHTHRDPAVVISSLCSLIATIRRATFETVDPVALGREMLDLWAEGARRIIAFRQTRPETGFVDVAYRELLADPMAVVSAIYARFGIPLDGGAVDRMRGFIAATPQHAHGEHRHRLADYGLNEEMVRERLAFYTEAFGEWL